MVRKPFSNIFRKVLHGMYLLEMYPRVHIVSHLMIFVDHLTSTSSSIAFDFLSTLPLSLALGNKVLQPSDSVLWSPH